MQTSPFDFNNRGPDDIHPNVTRHYHFSQNGLEWIKTQVNSREPLTMEYRFGECPELPYYCVERKEYYRFCSEHFAEPMTGEAGERAYGEEEIKEVIEVHYPNLMADKQYYQISEDGHNALMNMAKEILRLRIGGGATWAICGSRTDCLKMGVKKKRNDTL